MWTVETIAAFGLWALHVALALCVTAHVLLTKRDVGASISWIGLAWLSPFVGTLLYALFGINRVRARAVSLKEDLPRRHFVEAASIGTITDDHLSPLELTVARITGREADKGNKIALFHNGDEAYPSMLAAIEAARVSIALSTFILRLDHIGQAFVEALTEAHKRGVQVRVIVDGIGGGYLLSPAYRALRRNGVPVARFLHSLLPWRMPFLNLRTHKKLLCIDGRMAFTGGLNIGDENRLDEVPPDPVRDTHFLFEGPVVMQLSDVFAEDWLFVGGEKLAGEAWFPEIDEAGTSVVRAITSGPDQDVEKIETVLLQALASARQSIKIVTPYFLPGDRLVSALTLAAMRGVEVDIIVPEKNNHLLVGWAMQARIGDLIDVGCRVWSNPPPFDHSKITLVDGVWALIGSANWDMRSLRLNFELDVEIYHSDFVGEIDGALARKRGRLVTAAELRSRSLAVRLRDNAARLLQPYL